MYNFERLFWIGIWYGDGLNGADGVEMTERIKSDEQEKENSAVW